MCIKSCYTSPARRLFLKESKFSEKIRKSFLTIDSGVAV